MIEGLDRREIEYTVKGYLVAVHHSGEKSLNTHGKTLATIPEFGDSTGTRGAQVQDREVIRWAKTAALYASPPPRSGDRPTRQPFAGTPRRRNRCAAQ